MKKQFTMIMTIVSMFFVQTGAKGNDHVDRDPPRVRIVPGTFSRIVVDNGIKLLLEESASQQVKIEGPPRYADAVKMEVRGGVLYVSAARPCNQRALVYLPVQQLEQVTLRRHAEVSTIGVLNSANIKIMVEGDCRADIVTWGKIIVEHDDEHDVDFLKKERIEIKGNIQ